MAGYNNPSSSTHRQSNRFSHSTTTEKPATTQRHQTSRRDSPPPSRAPPPPPPPTTTATHRVTKHKPRPNNSKRYSAHIAELSNSYSNKDTRSRHGRPSRLPSATATATTAETGHKAKSSSYGAGAGSNSGSAESGFDASYRRETKRHLSQRKYTTSDGSRRREHSKYNPRTSSPKSDDLLEEDEHHPIHNSHSHSHSHGHSHKNRSQNDAVQLRSDDDRSQIGDTDQENQNNNDKDLLKKRKRSRALKAALTAGAVEAFRQRKRPGEWVGQKGVRVATAALSAGLIDIGLESRQQAALENDNNNGGDDDDDRKEQGAADGGSKSNVLGASSRLVSSALGGILIDKVANGGLV